MGLRGVHTAARSSRRTIGQVCQDLDLTDTAERRWMQQA